MKLVFFDIECASVRKECAKMCVFGYVICDEHFNVLEKEDLLINPLGRFNLSARKSDKGIVLPYNYADFKKYPSFVHFYGRIKQILEDGDSYVMGHAVLNDVNYLRLECRRFNLPCFRFSFNDSQLIFMTHINDFTRQYGLEAIAEELNVEFTPHRAQDDAYATMRVVQALCEKYNCACNELGAKLGVADGRLEKGNVTPPKSEAQQKYWKRRAAEKRKLSQKRIKFNNYFSRKRVKSGKLNGSFFTFSREIEDDLNTAFPLVDKIYANGGRYTQQPEKSNYYVKSQNDSSGRFRSADSCESVKILDMEEFMELLND